MILQAQKLFFSHHQFPILNGIDLNLSPGELVVIIGPNGAGKSTLLNILANEYKPHRGQIFFKEQLLSKWDNLQLASHKAKFSQEHNVDIGLNVKEIVMMGRYPYFNSTPHLKDRKAVNNAMKDTAIYPLRDRAYNSLSGGEKQRVHLARVLAQLDNNQAEKLAFFDEPLNNLDVRHQYRTLKRIARFTQKQHTALLVLHNLNLAAEFADKVLLLSKGNVISFGKPQEVFCEKTISKVYDFPCAVCPNPLNNCPMIIFGKKALINSTRQPS